MTFLETLAWLLVLIGTIWTGMFTRYVGQLLIDWSKQPTEKARQAKEKKTSLTALRATVGNARQYCEQMGAYLAGLPYNNEAVDEKLKDAAVTAGKMPIVPTFNLDTQILESFASSIFSILDHDKAQRIMTTRLEIRHVQRRIDTLAEMVFLRSTTGKLSPLQTSYIEGTRQIVSTTENHCAETIKMLDEEAESVSVEPSGNRRPWLIIGVIVLLIAAFVWATTYIDGISINLNRAQREQHSDKKIPSESAQASVVAEGEDTPDSVDSGAKPPDSEVSVDFKSIDRQGGSVEDKP